MWCIFSLVSRGKSAFNVLPGMRCRGSHSRSAQILNRRYRAPAIEHAALVCQSQHTRLKEPFGVLDIPIYPALQKLRVASISIER